MKIVMVWSGLDRHGVARIGLSEPRAKSVALYLT